MRPLLLLLLVISPALATAQITELSRVPAPGPYFLGAANLDADPQDEAVLLNVFQNPITVAGLYVVDTSTGAVEYAYVSGVDGSAPIVAGWSSSLNGNGFHFHAPPFIDSDGDGRQELWFYADGQMRVVGSTGTVGVNAPTTPPPPALLRSVPNPSAGLADIAYTLPAPAHVRLDLYDVRGRHVRTLVDGARPAGEHTATLDGGGVAPGTYTVRLDAGGPAVSRLLTIAR